MTEEEKALAGMLYYAKEERLQKERERSQELSFEYNQLRPSQAEEREAIIRREMKRTGKHFRIEEPFHCDFWGRVSLGENFFANYNLTILAGNEVIFGDQVLIGPNCGIYAAGHAFDIKKRDAGLEYALPIHIGNHVWIGGHVSIVSGVTIGAGSIIAAESVVVSDIPSNVLAGGNPCKVIRKIREEDDKKFASLPNF
ncbi:MAG TPA: maltose acetyltransferase [Lachnospiraceae bacterium]|jgi:acetyltransferase-like isoleucine patch superfamily enzyme|uniref:Acetyltransferase n=1 Tax=Muricomes intestini TaxID=1796634 RepID=A0A4R3K011_9FIRM|nr:sugar O-acetyltransferase [Muricomes intestini]TCS75032.1 galactoside O-acetyltransferase [Muricomes intestini]HCR84476.1 maltose acetyltransferase [Lachnospiraceae bacterium]